MKNMREKLEELINEGLNSDQLIELAELIIEQEKTPEKQEKIKRQKIVEVFEYLGLPNEIKGYDYILDVIFICKKNNYKTSILIKDAYEEIAEKNKTAAKRVERGIMILIGKFWRDNNNPENIKKIFGYSPEEEANKPLNIEFIVTIVEYLK